MADKEKIYNTEVSVQNKAALLIICTAQELQNKIRDLLKASDISLAQLTILHILDEIPGGKTIVSTIRKLMVDDNPNVSRSLNKLAEKKLIVKKRSSTDQRIVHVSITEEGRRFHRNCDRLLFGDNLMELLEAESQLLVDTLMKV